MHLMQVNSLYARFNLYNTHQFISMLLLSINAEVNAWLKSTLYTQKNSSPWLAGPLSLSPNSRKILGCK